MVETKGINQGRILGRDTTLMSRRRSVDEAKKEVIVENDVAISASLKILF